MPDVGKEVRALLERSALGQAEALLRAAVSADPASGFEGLLVDTLRRQGKLAEAEREARAAAARRPGGATLALLAETLLAAGKPDEAAQVLERAPAGHPVVEAARAAILGGPPPVRAAIERALAAGAAGRLEEAASAGEEALDSSGGLEAAWSLSPGGLAAAPGLGPALAARLRRRRADPWARYLRRLTDLRGRGALWDADFAALRALPPRRYGWMLKRCAKDLLLDGKLERARAAFAAVARAAPRQDAYAGCNLAEALLFLGRAGRAMALMDRLEREAADGAESGLVAAWRSAFLLWTGRYEEAAAAARRARELGEKWGFGWEGAALLKLGRPAEALPLLDEALARKDNDVESRVWKGEALLALGRPGEALQAVGTAETGDPNALRPNVYAHAVRGLALAALGRSAEADAEARALRALRPELARGAQRLRGGGGTLEGAALLSALLEASGGVRRADHEPLLWLPGRRSQPRR